MVEFALILIPLLTIVVGILQFGIGLNYWLDMNRLSNQGARWAVVNSYPGCARTDPTHSHAGRARHFSGTSRASAYPAPLSRR